MKISNAKYSSWFKSHDWDTCKLDLQPLGEFLCNYISAERDGFVLSLNGEWGSGKTEFLKRLYVEFLKRKNPTIYINAWESDFTREPLRVISSELINQLRLLVDSNLDSTKLDRAKSLLGNLLKGSAISLAQIASKQIFGEGDFLKTPMEHLLNAESLEFANKISEEYENQVQSIAQIREALSEYALSIDDVELPVVVLVDELDRCRPDYSIKMLESIKHFFDTKFFVFIIGNDTRQLAASIKVLYGTDFSSEQYLKRFFDRSFSLPEPDFVKYADIKQSELALPELSSRHPIDDAFPFQSFLSILFDNFDMKLRDIDQFFAKLKACCLQINGMALKNQKEYMTSIQLLSLCICMHEKKSHEFQNQAQTHPLAFSYKKNYTIVEGFRISDYVELISDMLFIQRQTKGEYFSPSLMTRSQLRSWEDKFLSISDNKLRNALHGYFRHVSTIEPTAKPDGTFKFSINKTTDMLLWDDYKKIVELSGLLD